MLETPLRFEITPGAIAAVAGHTVLILAAPCGSHVQVRDVATGTVGDVALIDLAGIHSGLSSAQIETHFGLVRNTTRAEWRLARRRERVLRRLIAGHEPASVLIRRACHALNLSARSVYRIMKTYRAAAQTSSLVVGHRGTPQAGRRLAVSRERIVMRTIEDRFLARPRATVSDVVEEIALRCRAVNLKPVSRKAVQTRIAALDARLVTTSRHGSKTARDRHGPVGGRYSVKDPLAVMQIDHTRVDAIAVSDGDRKPLCRPWLTLAIDVASRMVMGMTLSFDAPSITSVCLALTHACLPKDRWLKERGIDVEWSTWGIPGALHMDNAREFRSEAVRRGCDEYGIRKIFRPIATPHFGGHIERLIGTLMGRVHLLPGTTSSNVASRGNDQPAETATMTLSEMEAWISLEIAGRYHLKTHRSLGIAPQTAWESALKRGLTPSLPNDQRHFMINFLPLEFRVLQKDGIHLFNIRYWSERLPTLARQGDELVVRYDPRNLGWIFVLGADFKYHDVPYGDVRHPPISLWEHRAAAAWLRAHQRKVDEIGIFAAHEQQRAIVSEALRATRLARSRSTAIPSPKTIKSKDEVDYGVPAAPLEGEIWESPR